VSTLSGIKLIEPSYYQSSLYEPELAIKKPLSTRVFFAALPFIALHKPFGRAVTFTADAIKIVSSFNELVNEKDAKRIVQAAVAVSALAGTFFMHPLGLCISTLHDLGFDLSEVMLQLQAGNTQEAIYSVFLAVQHLLYLGTMVVGSLEIVALSMLFNMAIEVGRSKQEFQKGNILEGSSHMLMSLVRFSQAVPFMEKSMFKHNMAGKELSRKLTETVAKVRDTIAYHFYSYARTLTSPHWKLTETWLNTVSSFKNDECSSWQKTASAAKSVFSTIMLLPFALSGLVVGQTLHFSAFLLSTRPFIHLKGNVQPKQTSDRSFSTFQLNCCLPSGGFARMFGGIDKPNKERVEEIAAMILKSKANVVCLQEVSDLNDAKYLYEKLSDRFAEFYFHMGATPFILQNNSGLMVASDMAIEEGSEELHSFSDIKGTESMVNKCFFLFTTKLANFITTHLSPSSSDIDPTTGETYTRLEEQKRILSALQKRTRENNKSFFILGDMNIKWNGPEYHKSPLFLEGIDHYNQNRQTVTNQDATSETDFLVQKNWHHKKDAKPYQLIIDFFVSFGEFVSVNMRKVATFDVNHPKKAISDHAAFETEVNI